MGTVRRHLSLALGVCAIVAWTAGMGMLASGVMAPVPSATALPPIAVVPSEPELTPNLASLSPFPSVATSSPETAQASLTPVPQSPSVPSRTSPSATPQPSAPTVTPTHVPTPSPLPTPPLDPTPAATPLPEIALTCANGVDDGGGTGTICDVLIGPFAATVIECHGAAGDPRALCTTTGYAGRVTSVEACNGTANGGGATLRCSVTGVGLGSAPVTLCVGSGAGGTLVGLTCTWSGSSGVTVSICNGSGNGGGALVICSVREG